MSSNEEHRDWRIERLIEERRDWRKNHPYGFVAKPVKCSDGLINFKIWDCVIPYKQKSEQKQKYYNITIVFTDDYPLEKPTITHYDKQIYLDLLEEWSPCTTIKMILQKIKKNLDEEELTYYT